MFFKKKKKADLIDSLSNFPLRKKRKFSLKNLNTKGIIKKAVTKIIKLPKKTKLGISLAILLLIGSYYGYSQKTDLKNEILNVPEGISGNLNLQQDLGSIMGVSSPTTQETDKHLAFFFEVYDLILKEYWDNVPEERLNALIILALEKITGETQQAKSSSRADLRELLLKIMKEKDDTQKKDFVVQLSNMILVNLEPAGRSRLYSFKEEQNLINQVNNVNPEINRYDILGVGEEASAEEVETAYEEKINELESQEQTEEVQKEIKQVEKSKEILADETSRQLYDEYGIEPTIDYKLLSPKIFYIRIQKFSPATLVDLERVTKKVDEGDQLDTLIIDLRGNIGGAIDKLPGFLGPFIGNDQYAYQFFRKGEKIDFKTNIGWMPSLIRYKKVIVLIDGMSQSTAEVFASVIKKYNVGILVGEKTRGWGTIERVYQLQNQIDETETYSAFLVNHVTLREDGQPIEGRGVEPVVSVSDPNWQTELRKYFENDEIVNTVSGLINGSISVD